MRRVAQLARLAKNLELEEVGNTVIIKIKNINLITEVQGIHFHSTAFLSLNMSIEEIHESLKENNIDVEIEELYNLETAKMYLQKLAEIEAEKKFISNYTKLKNDSSSSEGHTV